MKKKNQLQQAHDTIPLNDKDAWRNKFLGSVCRIGFQLALSRSMLEMLCAISDGVQWNRAMFPGLIVPDNWIASQAALLNRGLIVEKSEKERNADITTAHILNESYTWQRYKLSPAGEKTIDLIRISGMFVQSDAAIVKRMRKA